MLIGMPGFERQLARYPQLYSRIGFAHHYLPLDAKDLRPVLTEYWYRLGLVFNPEHEPDVEALMSIVRITGGNFRLIERLMPWSPAGKAMTVLPRAVAGTSSPTSSSAGAAAPSS